MAENNKNQKPSTNTRGYHTSNANAIKPTAFEWSYYEDMVKLVFTDQLPENEQTENRRYDYDHSWFTFITRAKCLELYNAIGNYLIPAIKEKKNAFISVPVAEVNQFGIGVMYDDNGKLRTYAKLVRNIDPRELTSDTQIIYEFRDGELILDYDNSTGKFTNRVCGPTEFLLFTQDLDSFIKASSKAFNHANRVVDRAYKDMINNNIRAIGDKVGAHLPEFGGPRNGAKYGQTSIFSGQQDAPKETIKSLDELNDLPFN